MARVLCTSRITNAFPINPAIKHGMIAQIGQISDCLLMNHGIWLNISSSSYSLEGELKDLWLETSFQPLFISCDEIFCTCYLLFGQVHHFISPLLLVNLQHIKRMISAASYEQTSNVRIKSPIPIVSLRCCIGQPPHFFSFFLALGDYYSRLLNLKGISTTFL